MSDHTQSPVTSMLATHCAMCGLPLTDVESVQRGIGPICWGNAGFALPPEGTPDWDVVGVLLVKALDAGYEASERVAELFAAEDAHAMGNALAHAGAVLRANCKAIGKVVSALGYTVAGEAMGKRQDIVEKPAPVLAIAYRGDVAEVTFAVKFSRDLFAAVLDALRKTPGRRYTGGVNSFPVSSKRAFLVAVKEALPAGERLTIRSDKGELTLAA